MNYNLDFKKVDNFLQQKLNENGNIIICSYYEINFKLDISENDEDSFLIYVREKLENLGYDVYFTNSKYFYDNQEKIVNTNEALVAIKSV